MHHKHSLTDIELLVAISMRHNHAFWRSDDPRWLEARNRLARAFGKLYNEMYAAGTLPENISEYHRTNRIPDYRLSARKSNERQS